MISKCGVSMWSVFLRIVGGFYLETDGETGCPIGQQPESVNVNCQ